MSNISRFQNLYNMFFVGIIFHKKKLKKLPAIFQTSIHQTGNVSLSNIPSKRLQKIILFSYLRYFCEFTTLVDYFSSRFLVGIINNGIELWCKTFSATLPIKILSNPRWL